MKAAMDNVNNKATRDAVAMREGIQPMRRKPLFVLMLVFISTLACAGFAAAASVYSDRVAATVNGDVILESEVKEQKQPFVRKNLTMPLGVVPPGKVPTEKEILDELVVIRLLEQEATKKGIQMTDQGLDAAIKSLRQRNQLSPDRFIMYLAANGVNYADYRKMMRRQMVLSALINREVAQKAAVSEKEAQEYFKENKGRIDEQYDKLIERLSGPAEPEGEEKPEVPTHKEIYVGGRLKLRQIVLKIHNPNDKREKQRLVQTVRKIYDEIKTGADFAKLAKRYSQDSTASRGGALGTMDYRDMTANLQKMVQQMKVGEVAPPLTTRNSLVILNLAEGKNRKIKKVPIPKAERRRMERQIEEMVKKRKAERERAREAAREARKEDSESSSGKERGRSAKGVNKKPEKDPGILSDEEKKEYEKVRGKIMNILRSQKMRDTMKQWVQDLKKNAIIEVRL